LTSPPGNLFQQQEANRRRTTWLVIGFVVFFAWLGFGGDYILSLSTADALPGHYHHAFPWLGLVLSVAAIGIAAYAYRTGPQKVLWATGAHEVVTPQNDRERQLVNVVEEIAIAAGVPRPRIWLVPDDDPNAFATGHDPSDAHIAVTEGLLEICTRDELQAVIGHELGHVKNLDVRLMTTLAALVGAILLMRDGAGRMMRGGARFGGGGGGGGRGGKKGGGPLIAILLVLWIVSWLIAPLVTQLLAMAVSRKREYLADAMSAQFTRNPLALASALEKIEHAVAPTKSIQRGTAHLCIADPLGRRLTNREGWLADVLATHPPMGKRIAMLKGMGYAELKKEGESA
jgi:heat shock protein HtpX